MESPQFVPCSLEEDKSALPRTSRVRSHVIVDLTDDLTPPSTQTCTEDRAEEAGEGHSISGTTPSSSQEQPEDRVCGICFESPEERGVLNNCDHMFCFFCIRQWSKTANTCPLCKRRFTQLDRILASDPSKKSKQKVSIRRTDQRADDHFPPPRFIDLEGHLGDFYSSDEDSFASSPDSMTINHTFLMARFLFGNFGPEEDDDDEVYPQNEDGVIDLTGDSPPRAPPMPFMMCPHAITPLPRGRRGSHHHFQLPRLSSRNTWASMGAPGSRPPRRRSSRSTRSRR